MIRTKNQALAEAARRWGKNAAVRDDGKDYGPRYKVGRVVLGIMFEFEVKGEGRTWDLAFLAVDLHTALRTVFVRLVDRVGDRPHPRVLGVVAAVAADPGVIAVQAKIAAALAKLPPPQLCCGLCGRIGIADVACGRELCAGCAAEHRRRAAKTKACACGAASES